ncbi:hypothetical protein BJY00DRAFT_59752 [Aspergillus carlsbadensis]|nr:hypothetical protein BJY00DRAFT_59752 [Aspergillus carlsbadensis]
MRFTLNLVALMLASMAAAQETSSTSTPPPTGTATASPSATLNPDDFSCIVAGRGCDWTASEYGYGSDYCGSSPFEPFHVLSDGNIVLAVAQNGTIEDGCYNQTTIACCEALNENPCRRGEKYLECYSPENL